MIRSLFVVFKYVGETKWSKWCLMSTLQRASVVKKHLSSFVSRALSVASFKIKACFSKERFIILSACFFSKLLGCRQGSMVFKSCCNFNFHQKFGFTISHISASKSLFQNSCLFVHVVITLSVTLQHYLCCYFQKYCSRDTEQSSMNSQGLLLIYNYHISTM